MTAFAYDGFDRLSTTTYPDTSTEAYTYDADSNVLTRKTRKRDTIAFGYDTLNRPCTKVWATSPVACGGTSSSYLVSNAYDLASRLIGASDNSAAIQAPTATANYSASYTYDQLNRPTNVSWSPVVAQTTPTAVSANFTFAYDATNRRIGQTASDSSWLNYPTAAVSIAYAANNLNQYTAVGSASPTYDLNGNLHFDGAYTYCYDVESRLTSILSAGTCASPTTTVATYAYDAQGRRKTRTVGSATTTYATDADNRNAVDWSATGAIQNWYSYALGPDAVLNRMGVAGSTRATFIPDVIGSIAGSLDSASGNLTKYGYQTFGENPSATTAGFRYTARVFDPETAGSASQPSGLYYYRARTYSPTWGRFLQADPIGYLAGANLYAYVGNDPLNFVDPYGLWTLQLLFSFNVQLGPVTVQFSSGLAVDTQGNIAVLDIVGAGGGAGAQLSGGTSLETSTAATVGQLSSWFNNVSLGAAGGVAASLEGFSGVDEPTGATVVGVGVTAGVGLGGGGSATRTYTFVNPLNYSTALPVLNPTQQPSSMK